jgi:hypothetical protein
VQGSKTISGINGTQTFTMTVVGSGGQQKTCSTTVYAKPPKQSHASSYFEGQLTAGADNPPPPQNPPVITGTVQNPSQQSSTITGTVEQPPTYYNPPTYAQGSYQPSTQTQTQTQIVQYPNPPVYQQTQQTYVPPSPVIQEYMPPSKVQYVPLKSIPYTGAEDVFSAIFALVSAITTGYGALRMRIIHM